MVLVNSIKSNLKSKDTISVVYKCALSEMLTRAIIIILVKLDNIKNEFVDNCGSLDVVYLGMTVRNGVRPVGVDGAPILRAHQIRVDIESIGAAASSVAVGIVVGSHIVTSVKGGHHGVLVAFISVIFRAEVVIDKVGITIVVTT
jgi:hypothetical protein